MNFSNPWLVFGAITLVFLGFLASLLGFIWPIEEFSVSKSGVFGDSFGILTSLFNGLALGGLILTIAQQKNEFKQQHFENILFEMIRLHVDLTASIDLKKKNEDGTELLTEGRDCFKFFYEKLTGTLYYQETCYKDKEEAKRFEDAYDHFWSKWHKELGHYFRSLYTIFKYISDSDIKDKKQYANIVRAQLSDYELLVLFYNCLARYGVEKFKPLVTEYELFDNLPVDKLYKQEDKSKYEPKAFGSNKSLN
ncbi:putative phage abortive infection protein [Pseudomonas sp. GOM7]|uniref:putative phage abortive infection protein n=1 Tax=Pseudomonas sp. GOM7 TaxID=2998079 RepID=UPI00227C9D08|nr:putative phage abortive infection protein [Pseudomonas sp. GOM7]WAJ37897.1 putative phage abortive infection protein [Pseudomonas sp. GOM7]